MALTMLKYPKCLLLVSDFDLFIQNNSSKRDVRNIIYLQIFLNDLLVLVDFGHSIVHAHFL